MLKGQKITVICLILPGLFNMFIISITFLIGTMFFWAERVENKWDVNKIELSLKSEPDRRLLVKKVIEE